MPGKATRLICLLVLFLMFTLPAGASDWPTFGQNLQRNGWNAAEKTFTGSNVAQMRLDWKMKLQNESREMTALTVPIVLTAVQTVKGQRNVLYTIGSNNMVFALDADTGETIWSEQLRIYGTPVGKQDWLCPHGVNATPVADRRDNTLYLISSDGKLHRRDLGTGEPKAHPLQFVPPFSKNWSLSVLDGVLYTTISQGCGGARSGIYAMDLRDPLQPVQRFLFTSRTGNSGIWGRAGAAIGERIYVAAGDGPFNAANHQFGSAVVAATLGDVKLADWFMPPNNKELTSLDLDLGSASPVVIPYKGRELVAVGAKEGLVYLMDGKSLGGRDHGTPLHTTPLLYNDGQSFEGHGIWGGFSSWRDQQGTAWLYFPAWGPMSKKAPRFPHSYGANPTGSVMAFKVVDDRATGKPTLEPAWVSGDLLAPEPVVIANGLVFALASGENTRQTDRGGKMDWPNLRVFSTQERLALGLGRAVLHALDATTGKSLWNSGEAIETWAHFSAPVVANGRVYVVDFNSNVYAFTVK